MSATRCCSRFLPTNGARGLADFLTLDLLLTAASWIVPLVFAVVLHEIAHGWAASAFGDGTARRLGRLSLNPLRHVDPVGTVVLPAALALAGAPLFGWAKPVPVVAREMRRPRFHMMLVALAGPGMNFAMGLAAALLLALFLCATGSEGMAAMFVIRSLEHFVLLNIVLGLFNLLPLPPLDGSHVVRGLLPERLGALYARAGRFGFAALLIILLGAPLLFPEARLLERLLLPPVEAMMTLYGRIAGLA